MGSPRSSRRLVLLPDLARYGRDLRIFLKLRQGVKSRRFRVKHKSIGGARWPIFSTILFHQLDFHFDASRQSMRHGLAPGLMTSGRGERHLDCRATVVLPLAPKGRVLGFAPQDQGSVRGPHGGPRDGPMARLLQCPQGTLGTEGSILFDLLSWHNGRLRRAPPIVSANLRRKPPLIACPPHFDCAPLQLWRISAGTLSGVGGDRRSAMAI